MEANAFGTLLLLAGMLVGLAFLFLFVLSLVWVYRDAEGRGKTGCLWLLICFFTWPFGVMAYIILRDREVRL